MKRKIIFGIKLLIILCIVVFMTILVLNNRKNNVINYNSEVEIYNEINISCVGDSITYGYGLEDRSICWVSLLQKSLGQNYTTRNFGLNGRTVLSYGYSYLNEKLAEEFFNTNEDVVLFMLGTNDTKKIYWNAESFEKEYREFIQKIKNKKNNPKIYIMIPTCIFISDPTSGTPNNDILVNETIPIIKKIASEEGIKTIDLYEYTKNHSEWFNDGLHPNIEGNEEIAKEIVRILKEDGI